MRQVILLALSTFILACTAELESKSGEFTVSTLIIPDSEEKTLNRQGRGYYEPRYDGRPLYPRDFDRPGGSGCRRCYDERYDDERDRDSDYDRGRDRYDDDRRGSHRPTYGNRLDKNRNENNRDDDDHRYSTDRNSNNKNGTDEDTEDDKKRPHDDEDDRDRGSGRRRNHNRDRDRDRYDDRDRYRPDYYDRFLARDPYRERPYDRERPYLNDPYRRPPYERHDDPYGGFGGRYDRYGYPGYRRPAYDERYYTRGYDDIYGGYGPGVGRGPHDRPWDETYRGQAGWDAGGRGYYFASGRPEPAPVPPVPVPVTPPQSQPPEPAPAWQRPDFARPAAAVDTAWQNPAASPYPAGGYRDYRDPLEYRGSLSYSPSGYRKDVTAGYGNGYSYGGPVQASQAPVAYDSRDHMPVLGYPRAPQQSGWHSVGERIRPYRDQSGVNQISDDRDYDRRWANRDRPPADRYPGNRQPPSGYGPNNGYGPNRIPYGQNNNGNGPTQQTNSSNSTTTSYLFTRDEEQIPKFEETTEPS